MAITELYSENHQTVDGDSITLVSGINRYLIMIAGLYDYGGSNPYTSVSFNSTPMTELVDSGANDTRAQIFGLAIPDAWSGTLSFASSGGYRGNYYLFDGVDPSNPVLDVDSGYSDSASATSSSLTLAGDADGLMIDLLSLLRTDVDDLTKGSNQTLDYQRLSAGFNAYSISYYTTMSTGNLTMSWTWSDGEYAHVALSLRPYVEPSLAGQVIWFM